MTKKEKFIEAIDNAFFSKIDINEIDPEIVEFWEIFKSIQEKEKPILTDNGKMILKYMQDNSNIASFKAKNIAEGLFTSSRTVSGSLRKLVTDGFCEKVSTDPVVYALTEKGKKFIIE